ncbi:hypothetical protein [Providencia manganoxydans]|uniref:Uncharacterized protein n=1 Tax=Providencia stuartii TaxID=588 RepID=A0A1S1HMR3_PROST|nr:hypothetical protein A3Q29_21195 [Providencia stuartii]
MLAFNKLVIILLLLFAPFSFSKLNTDEVRKMKKAQYYRDIIIDCSQYIIGDKKEQPIKANISDYLKALDLPASDIEIIKNDVFKADLDKPRNKVPPHIELLDLNRRQGVPFCILQSRLAINHLLNEVNK